MDLFNEIWGSGTSLNCLQMAARGITVFFIALILIRVSGRRSFGMGNALDNIIVILLGAILSRAVVGASPMLPVITAGFSIVLLHRSISWIKVHHELFGHLIDGEKIVLYKDGDLVKPNMDKALVCEEDLYQGVRESATTNELDKVKLIFMERNGKISVVKKDAE